MINVSMTTLEGVLRIDAEAFEDHRGIYWETYNRHLYFQQGITVDFVQDDFSFSSRHVLRGLHGDAKTWKLVWCSYGKFYLVVVDCRQEQSTFGRWEAFTLSAANHTQILIPPHFGNGHLILSDEAMFSYKQSAYYDPGSQFSYRWDDPRFNIWWPIERPILSWRDTQGHY